METNKYYTPTIEEFHVGFTFLVPIYGTDSYQETIFDENTIQYMFNRDSEGKYSLPDIFRVKLLDREDIESLGFKHISNMWFSTNNYGDGFQIIPSKDNDWHISFGQHEYNDVLFKGTIKNKSELQKLMTQLNIKP